MIRRFLLPRTDCPRRWRRDPGPLRHWGTVLLAAGALLAGAGAGPAWAGAPRIATEGNGAVQPLGPPETTAKKLWGRVQSVESTTLLQVAPPDGGPLQVLLFGIDPPEWPGPGMSDHRDAPGQPYGQDAFRYVRDLLTSKQVQIESFGKDRRGRILAVVWLGDINVNLSLVKEGLAWVSPGVSDPRVRAELEVAERQAQKGKYGLWSLPNPEPPWVYRKRFRVPAA
jgi:endonuclease YncB( thermonuclease family)